VGPGVTLYEKPDFDNSGSSAGPFGAGTTGGKVNPVYSINMVEPKEFIAIVFDDDSSRCQVFNQGDRNLEDDYVSDFCGSWFTRKPCVGSIKVLGGKIIGELPR